MISEGSLQDFSLSDLLQIISLNASSGILRLSSEGRSGGLSCRNGEIVSAHAQDLQGEEAVYALFYWETGTFRFDVDAASPEPQNITMPLSELAKEGIRRLDLWRAIRREMPLMTLRARFHSERKESPEGMSAEASAVWRAVLGPTGKTLGEVVAQTSLSELSAAQALLDLWKEGMLVVETAPEEAVRSVFQRVSEEVYSRFASISGLKMTEGLEALLNTLARTKGVELRWRSGQVKDGLPGALTASALRPIYRDFLIEELEYVTKIHGPAFTEKALDEVLAGFAPEEMDGWQSLDLPAALTARAN